jgi:diadenosine tetraphosphate (Ap4A) HIT family hydrolase
MSDEAETLGPLIREVSRSLQMVLGCEKTYVVQCAEHQDHPHVHVHVIARARDLPVKQRGPGIFGLMGAAPDEALSADRMDEIASRLGAEFTIQRCRTR